MKVYTSKSLSLEERARQRRVVRWLPLERGAISNTRSRDLLTEKENMMTKKHLTLLILSIAVLGGWNSISAAEADIAQATTEKPLLTNSEEPLGQDLDAPAQDLELPVPDLELPPKVEASCHTEDCGNTGRLWGVGPPGSPDCVNARADLDSKIGAAANNICPGVVTGITRHFENDCKRVGSNCTESGNADIECKICPGQSCGW